MFKQLFRFGEDIAGFSEWVLIYPKILSIRGREFLMDQVLTIASNHKKFRSELIFHAKRVLERYDDRNHDFTTLDSGLSAETSGAIEEESSQHIPAGHIRMRSESRRMVPRRVEPASNADTPDLKQQ